jgi:hypothetical protein
LATHLVPDDESLRTAERYREFLTTRRRLLASAMTDLLDAYRPAWLDAAASGAADDLGGCTLDLTLYEGSSEGDRLSVTATRPDSTWRAVLDLAAFETSLDEAASGIESELAVSGVSVPVRPVDDEIEVALGPFLVFGTAQDWKTTMERERSEAETTTAAPPTWAEGWEGDRRRFPSPAPNDRSAQDGRSA